MLEGKIRERNRKNRGGRTISVRIAAGSQLQSIRVDRWAGGEKAEIRE